MGNVLDTLSLDLVASDSSTNGTIDAFFYAGTATSNDVKIVSLVSSAGFSASVVDDTLGTNDTEEAIIVTFDNSGSLLVDDGDTTNATLTVSWTDVGSGVTNSSLAALDVTLFKDPSSLTLAPGSLSMELDAPDASTNGTVTASFVAGTLSTDVKVVSVTADSGFSGAPGSFTLATNNASQDITVTFTDPGGLAHNQVVSSTLVVSWTEVGSGVTNEANAALDVTYKNPPPMVEEWTLGIDFGTLAPTGPNTFNQWDAYNNSIANDATVAWSSLGINSGVLQDIGGTNVAGVGLTVENQTGQNTSRADVTNGSTGPSPFDVATIYNDSLISNNQGGAPLDTGGYFVLTFTGLDDSMTYNLTGGYDGANANFNSTWSFDSSSAGITNTQNDTVASFLAATGAGYHTVEGLQTDGSGNLKIQVTRSLHVNVGALTLTAFSEALTAISDVSISTIPGNVVLSWGDGGTYNVETNASLVFPNWGVLQSGASPITNAIGSEPVLFYRLSN